MTEPGTPRSPIRDDPGSITRDDATCAIGWRVDDYEAIELYVDPALSDRAPQICESVEALSAENRDIDTLSEAIETYADASGLSASIYERPEDGPRGVIAVAFTLG